jgi:hypothetical protein
VQTIAYTTIAKLILRDSNKVNGGHVIATTIGEKRPPKQQPTVGGSTCVRPQNLPWQETQFAKVTLKVLYEDKEKGESTVLIKLEPGAHLPLHKRRSLSRPMYWKARCTTMTFD